MDIKLSQQQKQILSQSQLLNLQILQYNALELKEFLEKESLENPTFEVEFNGNSQAELQYKQRIKKEEDISFEEITGVTDTVSIIDFVLNQIRVSDLSYKKKQNAASVCGFLEKNGYITTPVIEISRVSNIPVLEVNEAITYIKTLEPEGVGAKDLKECLLLQIGEDNALAKIIIENYLEDVAKKRISFLEKKLKIKLEDINNAIIKIRNLNPLPGNRFENTHQSQYITPEFLVIREEDNLVVSFIYERDVVINISQYYQNLYKKTQDEKAKKYLKEKIERAIFFQNAIKQRKETVLNIINYIVQTQADFLLSKQFHLNPLNMKDVAVHLDIHPSTVSRAIKNKYVQTCKGVFAIKSLLSFKMEKEDYSTDKIKQMIKNIIENENKLTPFSDEKISLLLQDEGYVCSRRTVAKYRDELDIQTSSQRKNR